MRCILNGPFRNWARDEIVDIPQDQANDLIAAEIVEPWYPLDDDLPPAPPEGFTPDDEPTPEQVLAGVAALAGPGESPTVTLHVPDDVGPVEIVDPDVAEGPEA